MIVNKPWGHEYLVYENENVGLWYLHIKEGQSTSMHCHPKKNTGLVLLEGSAETSFLNNSIQMKSLRKIMIRRGLFHSTTGISKNGAHIFEIETPKDKKDLVRLEDSYGRQHTPYEGKTEEEAKNNSCLWITDPENGTTKNYSFCNCTLSIKSLLDKEKMQNCSAKDVFIFLKGGIITEEGAPVAQAGDVLDGAIMDKLSRAFNMTGEVVLLHISSNEHT